MEARTMIHLLQMTQLMQNHVILQCRFQLQQAPVQTDLAARRALAPTGTPAADADAGGMQSGCFGQLPTARNQPLPGLIPKPLLQQITYGRLLVTTDA